jgi:hypothetical protein
MSNAGNRFLLYEIGEKCADKEVLKDYFNYKIDETV